MDYVGNIFRPPSEADSLLVQVTLGCSHNKCAFCAMYREKQFMLKKWDVVKADLDEGLSIPHMKRVFLCDGDVMILSTERLLKILRYIKENGPHIERVSLYGDARGILHKSDEELAELKEAGLGMVYHGMESGDEEVLKLVNKGATAREQIQAAQKLKASGIKYSCIILLGAGGVGMSDQHAQNTAKALSEADPEYVGLLMLTLVPGTPMWELQEQGDFTLPDKWGLLRELRTIAAESDFSNCHFTATHASNYLPIHGRFPQDKDRVVATLDMAIATGDESILRPEWMRGL